MQYFSPIGGLSSCHRPAWIFANASAAAGITINAIAAKIRLNRIVVSPPSR
jgi:hypothetical protein